MKATVICPTHNRRKYIPQMIACFLSQTVTDSELIIADDGTDIIADIIPADNPRIRYFRINQATVGANRNFCCSQARGEFIVHFDDDDWSSPERVETQIATLERSRKQVLGYFNMLYWNVDTKKLYRFHPQPHSVPYGASFCYRKSWWEKHPFPEKRLGEDTDFGWEAIRTASFELVNADKFVVLRSHNSNTCSNAQFQGSWTVPEVPLTELPIGFSATLGGTMPKLLVAIKTCFKPNYQDPRCPQTIDWRDRNRCFESEKRRDALRQTWLTEFTKLGIGHKFFFGHSPSPQVEPLVDEVFLNCGDTYFDVSHKFKAMCQWTLDNGYDYMLLTDDDVFIYPDRLLNTDWAKFDYSGAACCDFIIGCCTFYSKAAMELFVKSPVMHAMDDAWSGMLLRANKIMPHILPNMHCFLGDKYNVYPENIPVNHNWLAFHVCSPEAIKTFWNRGNIAHAPSLSTPAVVPHRVASSLTPPRPARVENSVRPKYGSDGCTIDWFDLQK